MTANDNEKQSAVLQRVLIAVIGLLHDPSTTELVQYIPDRRDTAWATKADILRELENMEKAGIAFSHQEAPGRVRYWGLLQKPILQGRYHG